MLKTVVSEIKKEIEPSETLSIITILNNLLKFYLFIVNEVSNNINTYGKTIRDTLHQLYNTNQHQSHLSKATKKQKNLSKTLLNEIEELTESGEEICLRLENLLLKL